MSILKLIVGVVMVAVGAIALAREDGDKKAGFWWWTAGWVFIFWS